MYPRRFHNPAQGAGGKQPLKRNMPAPEARTGKTATHEEVENMAQNPGPGPATQDFVRAEIAEAKTELTKEIGQVETGLTKEIGRVETSLTEKIGRVETGLRKEIGRVETSLTEKIGRVETGLTEKIGRVETGLREEIGDLKTGLSDKINSQTRWLVVCLIGIAGAIIAALKWFV